MRTIEGVVASDKGNKTIKVVVEYQTMHPKYGKYLKRRTVLHAHDETNDAKEGDPRLPRTPHLNDFSRNRHMRSAGPCTLRRWEEDGASTRAQVDHDPCRTARQGS